MLVKLAVHAAGVVLLLFTGGHACELRWPLFDMREERAAHEPAPWTLGRSQSWTGGAELAAGEASGS